MLGRHRQRFTAFLERHDLVAGLSYAFEDLLSLATYHRQARRALQFGRRQPESTRIVHFERYGVESFVAESAPHIRIADYIHPGVRTLSVYDAEHETTYYATLKAYVEHDKNLTATARSLHVHRNTVSYRLNRIEALIGIDLQDDVAYIRFSFAVDTVRTHLEA